MRRWLISVALAIAFIVVVIVGAPVLRLWLATRAVPIGTAFRVISTGYASSPYQTDDSPCLTAAGTTVRPGVVATNFLPFGTLLAIAQAPYANHLYIVEDRMNSRYRERLDVWFPSTSEALAHGRRTLDITVVGYGTPGQSLEPSLPVEVAVVPLDAEPHWLERTGLELTAWSRRVAQLLGANVNRFDVDCTTVHVGEPAAASP